MQTFMKFPEDNDKRMEIAHILKKKINNYNLGEIRIIKNILEYDFVPKCICGSRLIKEYNERCFICDEPYINYKKEIKQCEELLTSYYAVIMRIYICVIALKVILNFVPNEFIIVMLSFGTIILGIPIVAISKTRDSYKKMEQKYNR